MLLTCSSATFCKRNYNRHLFSPKGTGYLECRSIGRQKFPAMITDNVQPLVYNTEDHLPISNSTFSLGPPRLRSLGRQYTVIGRLRNDLIHCHGYGYAICENGYACTCRFSCDEIQVQYSCKTPAYLHSWIAMIESYSVHASYIQ